ncbi:hypothetical protein J3E74DRAFT_473903 [Bipolaris maydis]|nr:hypothetical protein J3E74DRAFT_473903 [Bipolaris maydis]
MVKTIRPKRPTPSQSVNKPTPSDARVTADVVSASVSQSLCEDTNFSDDMSPLHSREHLTPTEPSVMYDESDSESNKNIDDFMSSFRSFQRLVEVARSTSYCALPLADKRALVEQFNQRACEMRDKYSVAFNMPVSMLEKKLGIDSDEIEDCNEEDLDPDDGVFEDEKQDALQATHSIQKTEAASASEKSSAKREFINVPLLRSAAAALSRELADLQLSDAAQQQSQEYHESESIGDDVKVSGIFRLEKSSIPKDTAKSFKQIPAASAKTSNSKDALIADFATCHTQSFLAKQDDTLTIRLATALYTFCMENSNHFTAEEALNVRHMCSANLVIAISLYRKATDGPRELKQAFNEWMAKHQDDDDNAAYKLRNEANETSVKREYCESEASGDNAHSAFAHPKKDHRGSADEASAEALWGTKNVIQHVYDCLNTWCNGRCVEELAHEADPTTVYPDSAQLDKDHDSAADGALADAVKKNKHAPYVDPCCSSCWNGDCIEHIARKGAPTPPYAGVCGSIDGEVMSTCAPGWEALNTTSVLDEQNTPDDTPDDSAPEVPEPTDYTVTYWATIEHEGQAVHIPIDSSNVSGPEKSIIEGSAGMNKVWKWVQEKGLTDKVSLQDAFDLAKDMQVESPAVEESREEESDGDDDSEYVPFYSSGSSSSSSESHRSQSPESRAWATSGTILGWAA